jgi:hypothetical protein
MYLIQQLVVQNPKQNKLLYSRQMALFWFGTHGAANQ